MNIQLNATFVVQIINFMVAYAVVRFVLLKPAVALIEAKEKKREELRQVIEYNYLLVTQEKAALYDQWSQLHSFYEKQAPQMQDTTMVLFEGLYPEQEYPQISQEVVQVLIKNTADELFKRVKTV